MKRPLHLFAALGFTSMVGQIVLMRELIVVFYGNELSLGIMLGSWLFWVGIGSLLAAVIAPKVKAIGRIPALAALQTLLGLAGLGSLMGVRALPVLLRRTSAGEIVGYVPIIVSSFIILAPMCLLLGSLFDLFCHAWSGEEDGTASIGAVYIFEALGAAFGGLVFAWGLLRIFNPSEIVCVLLIINLGAAAAMLAMERRLRPAAVAMAALTILVTAAAFFGGAIRLRQASLGWLWQNLNLVHSADSVYGNVAFIEDAEQKSLYENGLLMFSYPDKLSAEESVHFALLEQPHPRRMLLIGGGVSGSLNEALRHPVERVDYVELDPLVIKMATEYFPADIVTALNDPRVRVHTVDGRLFVKSPGGSYDTIVVSLPDPYTALINRFYTVEFFQECRRKLSPGGILSFRVGSAENYISPELQQFLGCLDRTLRLVFADVKVVPGESNIFLACNKPGILTLDDSVLIARLEERGIKDELLYVREYFLPYRLSEERKERLAASLAAAVSRVNADLAPVCYYYDAVLWCKQFKDISGSVLASFSKIHPRWILAAIAAVFAVTLLVQRIFPLTWGPKSILVAVATTGFAEITIEVVALLGFQAIHGYVYYEVAIILTAFMVGLTAGAGIMGRIIERGRANRGVFLLVQAVVCLYPLLLMGVLVTYSRAGESVSDVSPGALQARIAFPVLAFLAGCVGGLQFPLANALWLAERPGVARAAGYTYGSDLLGSCLGALLTTALLVPVFGIPFACVTASSLNFGSLLLLLLRRSTE